MEIKFDTAQIGKNLEKVNSIPVPIEKNTYTFAELWSERNYEQKFLIPDLIPKSSLCVLLGEDGIGKTQICTQLCLAVTLGFKTFLDNPLHVDHGRAGIIATEDARQKFTKAIELQVTALKPKLDPESVQITFTEGSNFDTLDALIVEITGLLKAQNYDLLIIDALSDLFTMIDGEINSNSHARKILSKLQSLCNTYTVSIILIHHAAKSKIGPKQKEGKIFIDKFDSQGAGAITQKPRTILALSNNPASVSDDGKSYTNYLHCVKANLMSKKFVTTAIECHFNGETLIHTFVNIQKIEDWNVENVGPDATKGVETVSGKVRKPHAKELTNDLHQNFMDQYFVEETTAFNRTDLIYNMVSFYGVGQNKITEKDGYIDYLINNKMLENLGGTYFRFGTVPF